MADARVWSAKGDVHELRKAYEGFHPDVRAVLEAARLSQVGDPRARAAAEWSEGRVVLLGDACHPMTPYMAQGAATAIEDAAVLARCLDGRRRRRYRGAFDVRSASQTEDLAHSGHLEREHWMKDGNATRRGSMATTPGLMLSFTHRPRAEARRSTSRLDPLACARSQRLGRSRPTAGRRGRNTHLRLPGPRAVRAGASSVQPHLFARDLAELFDHLAWETAAVAGCSMGGNIAQAFAAEYPQRTAALGLIDTTAWYGADAPARLKKRADTARAKGMRGMIDFQLTRWFSDEFCRRHPDVLKRTTDIFAANDLDCYAASCELLGAADSARSSARSRCRSRLSSARKITRRRSPWRDSSTRRFRSRRSASFRGRAI